MRADPVVTCAWFVVALSALLFGAWLLATWPATCVPVALCLGAVLVASVLLTVLVLRP